MDYILVGHGQGNALIDAVQMFFPNEKYKRLEACEFSDRYVLSTYMDGLVSARFFVNGASAGEKTIAWGESDLSHGVKLSVYYLFKEITGTRLPWGILTGIRPAKIAWGLLENGMDEAEASAYMQKHYLAEKEKADLSLAVARAEKKILSSSRPDGYSLYVGIPFCPSRCLYCSFTSYPIEKYAQKAGAYVDRVLDEMDAVLGEFRNKPLETIYIGGGTPTSIDDDSFEKLLAGLRTRLDVSHLQEFSVEAGRPDTINKNKLGMMKRHGVSRISINPQTINDKTLEAIGRRHTAGDFQKAFRLARHMGFRHINIDLILGLDGEGAMDVRRTLEAVTALAPEEITIHTLAVKRASRLKEELPVRQLAQAAQMEEFLSLSKVYMDNYSYRPYYMYRQKNMLGNFENVGYAKEGFGSVYNVAIMEERQHILAFGAGSVSKFVDHGSGRIERSFNVKDPQEYMDRTAEMARRKQMAMDRVKK